MKSRLAERALQKILLQGQQTDLGVQLFEVNDRLIWLACGTEHVGGAVQQLFAPLVDLRGVQVVFLC